MKFGSKRIMLVLTAPVFLCWSLIYFGDTYYHILISRFCTGLTAGGVQSTIILYISEIADNRQANFRNQKNIISSCRVLNIDLNIIILESVVVSLAFRIFRGMLEFWYLTA